MEFYPKNKSGWLRVLVFLFIIFGLSSYFLIFPYINYVEYKPQIGDVLFQSFPKTELTTTIEGCTNSYYSHCGVVVNEKGEWLVIEAVGGVIKTPLLEWIYRGCGGKFAAYRLRPEYRSTIPKFVSALYPFLGKPYDIRFKMDDNYIYCSELVYKAFKKATGQDLGKLVKLGDLNWKPYEKTIRKYEGGPLPLDRLMITPKDLSQAKQLVKVYGGRF